MIRLSNNARMALRSISVAKWRSFLTMLGVIIGVSSVITIVSLGEGVKHQLTDQIKHTGNDLITVRAGRLAERNANGKVTKVNLLNLFAGQTLSDADYQTVQTTPGLSIVAPFASITGVPKTDDGSIDTSASVVATNDQGAQALSQDISYGSFFSDNQTDTPVAVIGQRVASQLFHENAPTGHSFQLRGRSFTVLGVFANFDTDPLTPGVDYNNAIFIPYDYAKKLPGLTLQSYQILAKPADGHTSVGETSLITKRLQAAHAGTVDFTVLQASDTLAVANNVLTLLTGMVSAIAAISLLVGGIGIMNIMLVSVSERTHEIGVRKSVGATNRQILSQFLTEAVVLSAVGGLLGVLLSLLANYLLRVFTSLQPVITLPIMGIAVLVAIVVGAIFGITPALQAARKDPIEALRRI